MYYVWEPDLDLEDEFSVFSDNPSDLDMGLFISSEKIVEKLPIYELVGDEDSPASLSDVLLTDCDPPIFSEKLQLILAGLHVPNIQYFPVKILNREKKEVSELYKAANIIGAIDCLNFEQSDYTRFFEDEGLMRVARFQLLEDKISAYATPENPPLMFRLGEFKGHLLVHERIKDACQKANITGVRFIRPEDYT